MTWAQAEAAIEKGLLASIESSFDILERDIKSEAPVDTGASKAGYKVVGTITGGNKGYALVNYVVNDDGSSYIPGLWAGYAGPGGPGSQQLPLGHWPTVARWYKQDLSRIIQQTTF